MPPFSFKSPMFLAGTSVVGTGGVSVAGWQIWEEVNITTDKKLMRQGFSKSVVPQPNLVSNAQHETTSSSGSSRFQFKPYGCFNSFFPMEGIKSGDFESINHTKISDPFKVDEMVKEGIGSNQHPAGCVLMNMFYEGSNKFIFKSEVTVKNDKFGGVLGTGVKYDSSKEDSEKGLANYYVLFLKKQNSDKGKIKGGYAGFGGDGKGQNGLDSLVISSPDNDNGKDISIDSQDSLPKEKKYAGFGETTDSGGTEIFESIRVHDKDGNSVEILGKSVNEKGEIKFEIGGSEHGHRGYKGASAVYTYSISNSHQGQELSSAGGVDISKTLDTLYSPFKGRKGSGTKVEDYCENKPKEKYLNAKNFETIKNLCYQSKN